MTEVEENKKNIYVARQPIFRRTSKVFGYELLFRSGSENFADPSINDEATTSKVMVNSFLVFGLRKLTEGKRAFINFNAQMLTSQYPSLLPREDIVIEILEDIVVTPELIYSCRKLVDMGYMLALDDFIYKPEFDPLLKLAKILKFQK